MAISSTSGGLVVAVIGTISFGASGGFIKPLLDAGWSPTAAVTARVLVGGLVLLPLALVSLRGHWSALWRARWRVILMALAGVAATQLFYFAAIRTIPVSTALLIELLAPLLLVGYAWAMTRRLPRPLILIGSVLAVGGLVLVIGPGALHAADPLGLLFAFLAMIGCAIYFVVAARPSDGLPPVAFAASGLVLGGLTLGLLGITGLLPFTAKFGDLPLAGVELPWWVPLLIVAVVSTAVAYVAGITAAEALGSRLASFVSLLEVVFASLFAWLLLGEQLTPLQLLGGVLILGGIAAVRAAGSADDDPTAPEPTADDDAPIGLDERPLWHPADRPSSEGAVG
ncbi:DMT family transporter [Compostimonas suwonensis]|uniref:Threonine/homoserine efflux transporter RhtA n=1 Tax=Compostimonas suwonensis TaxID=1048394 RepID=A0A2M9BBB1_9MICO|nr:DMT family transporter [Compostimonas suwonensis]PJJ55229.1 threonine/homoserine efflux transporter RhtA [Compostimonas suwonensis]